MAESKKSPTIYDIAKMVGFSPNTVSRVLNNKGYISQSTREKILNAAKKSNYVPNNIARSLKNSSTKQILLAVPFMKETFNFDYMAAIQSVVQMKGYSLLLTFTESDIKQELNAVNSLMGNHADGLIMTTINITNELIDKLKKAKKPCVLCSFTDYSDNILPLSFDYVCVDTKTGIYQSTKHLITQGHTNIGYIGPSLESSLGRERYCGFELAMMEAGLEIESECVFTGGLMEVFGYECANRIAHMNKKPTAICFGTDLSVLGAYNSFRQNGIEVCRDMAVIGMDNISACTMVNPQISTVALQQEQMGYTAVNLLFERIEKGDMQDYAKIKFDPRLVIRESSMIFDRKSFKK
jgi:LacI family transcriptional regulator